MKYAVPPLVRQCLAELPSGTSDNVLRVIGRTRLFLLRFQKSHSGRYFCGFPRCLAPTGSSLAGKGTHTCSHHCVCSDIVANYCNFVKGNADCMGRKQQKKSSRGSEASRGIFAISGCSASVRCVDPSISLRFSRDDIGLLRVRIKKDTREGCPYIQIRSISSALFRVVSVMLVPPMIRASSFLRPSMSRGVTEV